MERTSDLERLLADLDFTVRRIRDLVGDDVDAALLATATASSFEDARRTFNLFEIVRKVTRVGGWRLDLASDRLDWSDEVFAIHDLPPGEAPPAEAAMIYCAPEWQDFLRQRVKECAVGGEAIEAEFEIITAKGRRAWVRSTAEPVRDDSGRITHIQGALQDISREMSAEAVLAMSEDRFKRIANALPMLIWTADPDGHVDYANVRFDDISGQKVRALAATEWVDAVAPEDRSRAQQAWGASVRTGQRYSVEFRILRADGEHRWMHVSAEPLRAADGRILKWYGSGIDIHDRVLAEDEALRLANQLQLTLDSISDSFVAVDGDWHYTILNARAAEFFRRPQSEIIGRNIWEIFPTLLGTPLERVMREVMARREARRIEHPSVIGGRTVEVSVFPADDGGLAIYFRNVHAEIEARQRLEQQEARFRAVTEAATDVVWDWDFRRGVIWWSKGLTEVFGYPEAEVEVDEQLWVDRLHPEERHRVVARIRDSIRNQEARGHEQYRFRHADGSYRDVDVRAVLLRDAEGAPVRMVGGMSDITERRRAEAALARQAALLNQARDAILVIDGGDRVQFWNHSAQRIYGYSSDSAVGQSLEAVLGAEPEKVGEILETVRAEGQWRGRMQHTRADGVALTVEGHWVLVDADDAGDGQGDRSAVMAINTDISEQVLLEEQLQQAQRLESVGQLTGGIAHDFNNLLTVMLGNADLLVEGLQEDAELQELAGMIRSAAERAGELTSRLLAFARKQPLDPRSVDVNRLVVSMDRMLRRTLGEHVEIKLVQGAAVWPALVDEGQLENALLNLCINARDAMPHGGKLVIETGNAYLDDAYASLHADVSPGQYVHITISDTGVGMAPDTLERVFDPFFTTKEVGHGSGLGLSMVYGFIRQSRGHVRIYSELEHGTTVRLHLPRALSSEDAGVDSEQAEVQRGAGERILLVEDDELVREYTQSQLESLGYRVVVASSGPEGLEALRQAGDFDLLFTDVVMPGGMSGRDLADAARLVRPNLPVVFTSGYTESAIVHQGRLEPGVQLLNKPYRKDELAAKVRQVLEGTRA